MKHLILLAAAAIMTPAAHAQVNNQPTMGWSSWNTFALNISEALIKQQADAMVTTGLADAGYKYVNIDDGYWNGRGRDGRLILNTDRFPSGMRHLTDYIHQKGLKAGIYSDAGDNTCGSGNTNSWGLNVGFYDHEDEDCQLYFADWNFDFIKVDYCGANHLNLNEQLQYTRIGQAIRRQAEALGKKITFNVCRWAYPGTWISDVADSWRTTGDIYVVAKDMEQLHGPKRAVVVMNLGDSRRSFGLDLAALEFAGPVTLHDCLTGTDTDYDGTTRIAVTIPAHGSQAYFVTGTRTERQRYQGEEAWANKYQEINGFPNARPMEAAAADQGWYMGWLGNLVGNYIEWRNVYSQQGGQYRLTIRYATAENRNLQVHLNGQELAFLESLNSGGWDDRWATLDLEVSLRPGFNTLRLGEPVGFAPNIDYIELTPTDAAAIQSPRTGRPSAGRSSAGRPSADGRHSSVDAYDLQGRPLADASARGPVVVDGRVVLN